MGVQPGSIRSPYKRERCLANARRRGGNIRQAPPYSLFLASERGGKDSHPAGLCPVTLKGEGNKAQAAISFLTAFISFTKRARSACFS
jgi:hypothetical protein